MKMSFFRQFKTLLFSLFFDKRRKLTIRLFFFVFNFTDSFVNSQEWTISRSVPELRLGIVGSLNSGKSALVHRYLTGSYMQEESPEGGRFKKEIFIDNQSYLLLIRDEGGLPEMQVRVWLLFADKKHKIEIMRTKNEGDWEKWIPFIVYSRND